MLSAPKLHDDGSNWMDYEPWICRTMASKGLWMHVKGTAIVLKPYAIVNTVPVLSDSKTKVMDEQLETWEARIVKFEKCEYFAQHIILSPSSDLVLSSKTWRWWSRCGIQWNDATTKSTFYLIDAEDQLASMCVNDTDDPKTHLTELKQHFELMTKHYENLGQMGSTTSDTHFATMIMSSLLPSYWLAIQLITAAEQVGTTQGTSSKPKMLPANLTAFFIEEAQHCVIDGEWTKAAESALLAHGKTTKKGS